jgi:hypothetical protein
MELAALFKAHEPAATLKQPVVREHAELNPIEVLQKPVVTPNNEFRPTATL